MAFKILRNSLFILAVVLAYLLATDSLPASPAHVVLALVLVPLSAWLLQVKYDGLARNRRRRGD